MSQIKFNGLLVIIMNSIIDKALITGVERLSGWVNLLDEINVYPVADGDTGRNLIISLSPLLHQHNDREKKIQSLLLAARGNSGNIAARFLSGLLTAHNSEILPVAAELGRDYAWDAVKKPPHGSYANPFPFIYFTGWDAKWYNAMEHRRPPEAMFIVLPKRGFEPTLGPRKAERKMDLNGQWMDGGGWEVAFGKGSGGTRTVFGPIPIPEGEFKW